MMKITKNPPLQKIALDDGWRFQRSSADAWYPARVPGCVHADLLRNNLIPDPFWGENEQTLRWIEEEDWGYRCDFEFPEHLFAHEFIELVAEGLDTVATISINDQVIARTENMFAGYRFEVKQYLRRGINRLEIHFSSPMPYIRSRQRTGDFIEANDPIGGASHIRKEQCSFGWDWGPRFPTCGIYKPIRFEAWSENRIESVRIIQKHNPDSVELTVFPELANNRPCGLRATLSFEGNVVAEAMPFAGESMTVEKPELWWPNGHGEQPLYELHLELSVEGDVIDTSRRFIGLRTVALDRHPDEYGESFQFVVNGRPVFCKGANWIPAHSFVSEVTVEHYEHLLDSSVSANMNMLRIWGGGIYENDIFYDLCDKKGILIWQDFMFACAMYSGKEDFLNLIGKEAEYQIKRLGSRTCLALWCGNNEIEQMTAELFKTPDRKEAYDRIFHQILPNAVEAYGGSTSYWPCSPHHPAPNGGNRGDSQAGDAHFWDVWHKRRPVKTYEETKFRFCSEFGMQSYSSPEVASTFCSEDKFNVFGPEMENHQKNAAGNLIIFDYLARRYRFPKDYTALAYLSQLNQAYCMKTGVEHFRRSMPRTMGALYWQLNDCWPVFSWSSIEFNGHWKALHYAAKRFFSPLLVSAFIPGDEWAGKLNGIKNTIDEVHVYTVYDAPNPARGKLSWIFAQLDGTVVSQDSVDVELNYGESRLQRIIDLKQTLSRYSRREILLRLVLTDDSGKQSEDTVLFTSPRFIDFPSDSISVRTREIDSQTFDITFECASFQHQVEFHLRNTSYFASDNFFDLFPGEERRIRVELKQPLRQGIDDLLTVRSIKDAW